MDARRGFAAALALAMLTAANAVAAGAQAAGDARRGERVYAACLACHTLAANAVGPRHCGVVGRKAGTVPRFDYSPAMRDSKLVWDEATLDRFLADPMKAVPGTSMVFSGVKDPKERADLIAYLRDSTRSAACGAR